MGSGVLSLGRPRKRPGEGDARDRTGTFTDLGSGPLRLPPVNQSPEPNATASRQPTLCKAARLRYLLGIAAQPHRFRGRAVLRVDKLVRAALLAVRGFVMAGDQSDEPCARVFISCGQMKGSDEVSIAHNIRDRLFEMGFDPYIAVEEQTLDGLKENIFKQLSNSEYFVFIDFKREQLSNAVPHVHRGSLFSHQELAIASYLGIEVLAFQESGVKPDDGIIRFLQVNATPFSDRHLLPNVIADEVRRRRWDPRWKADLILESVPAQFSDTLIGDTRKLARFFHIIVRNRHRCRVARNCYVYLEDAVKLEPERRILFKKAEFKWAGYSQPNASILPGGARAFDAFFILHESPLLLGYNTFATGTDFIPRIEGEGKYRLKYLVLADNFPESRRSFVLDLNPSLQATALV
jgi:hypothetical protein